MDAGVMLLEVETGFAKNEPVTFAVRKAIEKGVVDMINKGAKKNLWEFDVPVVEAPERKLPMLGYTITNNILGFALCHRQIFFSNLCNWISN